MMMLVMLMMMIIRENRSDDGNVHIINRNNKRYLQMATQLIWSVVKFLVAKASLPC